MINKEAYRKPKRLPGSPHEAKKKFQGRYPEIISLVFWMKLIFHKDILKLTNLYQNGFTMHIASHTLVYTIENDNIEEIGGQK